MAKLYNLARMTTATTGTGTITLGSAVGGYLTFALAGVSNGDVVTYGIKDGANSEVGIGTYTSSGTTLTRTVTQSTNANAAISLSGSAEVFITARKEDLANLGEPNQFTGFPILIGANASGESDPVIEIVRTIDNTGSGDAHGFADTSIVTRTTGGPIGYASYDGLATYSGTGNFNHHVAYQSRPIMSTTGTTARLYSFASLPVVNNGVVTNLYHNDVSDCSGTGTVSTQYGLHVASLTKGTINWAIMTDGTTPSRFGGNVDVGGLSIAGNDVTGVWTAYTPTLVPGATPTGFTTSATKGYSRQLGKMVWFYAMATISANGSGSVYLSLSLPYAASSKANAILAPTYGTKSGSIGLTGTIGVGATATSFVKYDGTYPGVTGDSYYVAGCYEID